MTDEARFRGGLRNQRGNATWPFATLTVTRAAITIRSPLGGAVIRVGDAVHIAERQGLLSRGVQFTTESPLRKPLTFWTRSPDDVLAALTRYGWRIAKPSSG